MQTLPIGIQTFEKIINNKYLYVDKTDILVDLIKNGELYFLARPRRFGKSLTISTLKAMFAGKSDLFNGLKAYDWVCTQSKKPSPVLNIDMSRLRLYSNADELNDAIVKNLQDFAFLNHLKIESEPTCTGMLLQIIYNLYRNYGMVVVLIDEYDKPILDNINNIEKIDEFKKILHSFYTVLKSCDEYLRFVFITGISKFSKLGIFSGMNNLNDITINKTFSTITGYTHDELEKYFMPYTKLISANTKIKTEELFTQLKFYYDGYSFDGDSKVYNPFSILKFFDTGDFDNFWYESGSPTFLVKWLEKYQALDPEKYRHMQVSKDFINAKEIENADINSFLFQAGYLTIENKSSNIFTLDYPNFEVKSSMARLCLENFYKINNCVIVGNNIWKKLKDKDLNGTINIYNLALKLIPYEDFAARNEYWYRSLFLMLLLGAGIIAYSEVHTYQGRSDVVIQLEKNIYVFEFKFVKDKSKFELKKTEDIKQLKSKCYADAYKNSDYTIFESVIVAVDNEKQVFLVNI